MNARTIPAFLLLLGIALLLPLLPASAQIGTADGMVSSQQGTEYFVSFPQNGDEQRKPSPRFLGLWITSQVPTTGTIEIPNGQTDWTVKPFTTKPGELTMIELPASLEQIISEEIVRGGVRILSRDPISVYAYHSRYLSAAAYPAVPVNLWGRRYLPLSLPAADGSYNSARTSQIQIVAAFDGTLVTIRPSVRLYTKAAGEEVQVVLKKGETYLFQAFKDQSVEGNGDLSGTEITSNFPIGVVTGHVRAPITVSGSFNSVQDYASHQAAMILPDSLWGQEYYSAPMNGAGRFRAIASSYNTQITVTWCKPDGAVDRQETVTLNRGELFDTRGTAINGASYWSATRPILVMQHQTGGGYSNPLSNAPAMVPLTAADQFTTQATIAAPAELRGEQFQQAQLTVLAKGNGGNPFGDLQLDGVAIGSMAGITVRRIGQTPCWYATLPVASGGHLLAAVNGVTFTGTLRSGSASDGLTYTIPTWVPQVGPDTDAPFVKDQASVTKGEFQLDVSDRTQGYFSGVNDVRLLNSPGWKRVQYSAPLTMDDDATAFFKSTSDPSGPLSIQMCDNVGNCKVIELPGVCFKTASLDRNAVAIETSQGKSATERLNVASNICGDEAHLELLGFVGGDAGQYLAASLNGGGATTATIAANSAIPLAITVVGNPSKGSYSTTLRLKADDSTLAIPITLEVSGPSGVDFAEASEQQRMVLAPNPFTTSTFLLADRPLGSNATLIVSDHLGRMVRSFQPDQLAGKTRIEWDGTSNDGSPSASGMYLLRINDGRSRTVRSVLLLR